MRRFRKSLLTTLIVVAVVMLAMYIILPFIAVRKFIDIHVNHQKEWVATDFGLESQHFFLKTNDSLNISAWEVAVDTPKAVIICLSGIHNPSVTTYFGHSKMFKEHGYASILLEMRAHGQSDGNEIGCAYKEYHDVAAAVKYIESKPLYTNVPIVVMGVSMGASSAINSIGEIPEIDGLISLSAFASWEDMFKYYMSEQAPKFLVSTIKPFILFSQWVKYGENVCKIRPKSEITKLNQRPALLMHSTEDNQVPFENFNIIMENAPSHVVTFVRNGNEHFITPDFTQPENDEEYTSILMNFLNANFSTK